MKKIILLLNITLITSIGFAQCDPATIKDMPTVYSKGYGDSWKVTPEQDKYMTAIFTSVIEPALKSTRGLKGEWYGLDGDWEFRAGSNGTPDGLTSTTIRMYMSVMGCSKDKKIYEKHETGLVINFDLNSLHFISTMSEVETDRNGKTVHIPNKIAGSQIYQLNKSTESDKYASLTFYSQTSDAKYFLITKIGSTFFIPVTIKQALELSISNITASIEQMSKKKELITILPKEAWIKKEGTSPIDGAITVKQAQEVNDAGYKGYVEGSNMAIKSYSFFLDGYKKYIEINKEFLKTATADILEKPATVSFLAHNYVDISELRELANESPNRGLLVTINNTYLNSKVPRAAPQFICIELRGQTNDAVTKEAFKNFEEALDFKKLESLFAK